MKFPDFKNQDDDDYNEEDNQTAHEGLDGQICLCIRLFYKKDTLLCDEIKDCI